MSSKWSLVLRFSHQNLVCISILLDAYHTSCPPHSSGFDYPNNIWWRVQIMNPFNIQIRSSGLPIYSTWAQTSPSEPYSSKLSLYALSSMWRTNHFLFKQRGKMSVRDTLTLRISKDYNQEACLCLWSARAKQSQCWNETLSLACKGTDRNIYCSYHPPALWGTAVTACTIYLLFEAQWLLPVKSTCFLGPVFTACTI